MKEVSRMLLQLGKHKLGRKSTDSINYNDYSVSGFYISTSSGDHLYDIFDNQEEIITEDSIVWVDPNKTILEGRVIKTPFSDFPEDSKDLKLIWINKKEEDRVLIRNCSK